jgi:hypothetical protein
MGTRTLSPDLLHKMDAYWRVANYLAVFDNQLYTFGVALMSVQFSSYIRSMLNRLADCPDGIVPLEACPRAGGCSPQRSSETNPNGDASGAAPNRDRD